MSMVEKTMGGSIEAVVPDRNQLIAENKTQQDIYLYKCIFIYLPVT